MAKKPLSLRFIVTATLLGNTLEWFDFATFGFLIPIFAKLYFPENGSWQALMHTMGAYYFGTLSRPIGGILFGFIGDRFGRRFALLSSVLLMTVPVFLISILPTYAQIGIAAPLILYLLRLFQGIAAGGEFPGTVTFLFESATPQMRGFYGSFAYLGVGLGILLGGTDFFIFGTHFNEEAFASWGWRSIFFVGALLGLCAFLMRRKLQETPVFKTMRHSHETLQDPIWVLLKKHKMTLVKAAGITILETTGFNLIIPFSLIYLTAFLRVPYAEAIGLNLLLLACLVALVPLAGKLASKVGPKRLAVWTAWAFLIFSGPIYKMMQFEQLRILGSICLALLLAGYWGSNPAILAELFPGSVRFSGIGIGYNMTVGVIGGICPILALDIMHRTGSMMIPAVMLMLAAIISLITFRTIRVR